MIKALRNRIYVIFLALLVIVCSFFSILTTPVKAFAAEQNKEVNFEETNVLDDLRSAKNFNIFKYPFYNTGNPEMYIMNVVEYCYSFDVLRQGNYGLYLYIYNPNAQDIEIKDGANKVQMAISYNEKGEPNDYEKFDLKYCSKSEEEHYEGLFYKFKVIDHISKDGKTILQRVSSSKRRYDISGFEIQEKGKTLPVEYTIGGTYIFSGYAQGYGVIPNEPSDLVCEVKELEVVNLSVKHTFYRSQTSALGAGHQNQLDTVYFQVPKRLLDDYGKLQRIKAEWYEYVTKDIVVTSNGNLYNKYAPYIGVSLGPKNQYGTQEYREELYYSLGVRAGDWGGGMHAALWGYNLGTGFLHEATEALYYLFLVDNISAYDPYASIVNIGGVQSNDLYQYIMNYNITYDKGTLPVKDGSISADLFEDDIQESRKIDNENGKIQKGYSYYDFDADVDIQTIQNWSGSSHTFWENWINFGLGSAFTGGPEEESRTAPPIQILTDADLQGSHQDISNRLMINYADVGSVVSEYRDAVTVDGPMDEEKVVVLFRFATSDYQCQQADIIELNKGFLWSDKHTAGQAYVAKETVFLNFDIIQLTFNKDGVYTVIPAVSSPIDIIDDITPPVVVDNTDWLALILTILLIIIVLMVLSATGILPLVIKFIIWLLLLPFKLLFKFFKWIFKKRPKKE